MLRSRGSFGSATLQWRLTANGSQLAVGAEFENVKGHIVFAEGQTEQSLGLFVLADGIPEYSKVYTVELYNVTGKLI